MEARMNRLTCCSLSFVLLAVFGGCGGSASGGAHFDESACPFVVDPSQVQGTTIRCGILYTPEVHASPSRYIEVPVLIFKGKNPSLPPVVNLSGGPGQSWADLGLDTFTASDTRGLSMDVVFIEQRGTGLSRPRLDCPAPTARDTAVSFATRCTSDLKAQALDTSAYNIQEMADDVATFQSVLGYPKVVLDGVSYGTAWGLAILRAHSSIVSSALLDSVVNPTIPTFSASASATDAAFNAAFAACSADAACTANYGDLKSKMETALANLKAKPLTVAGSTTSYDDNAMFGDAVSILAFAPKLLPRMVSAVTLAIARGNGSLLYDSDIRAIVGSDSQALSGIAEGQYFSVLCTDNQFVSLAQVRADLVKVNPAFSTYLDFTSDLALCQSWPYRQRNPNDYTAVTSAVPTLLVSGAFDPLTSPSWAQAASTTLTNGYWVEFPGLGHDEGASTDSCPQSVLSGFINAPGPPDASCTQSMTISFAAPSSPVTVVVDAQQKAGLPVATPETPAFAKRLAMVSRIEHLVALRHVKARMASLSRLAR
jgi:pimeloyl-ACP methyl ester carboxylesterase